MPIVKPLPQAVMYGINDRSRLIQFINEQIPAHFPLIYTLAGWGSYDGEVVSEVPTSIYGSDITDPNSPYGTHQSLLAGELLGVGNSVMCKRVKLEGAKQALIRLSLEVATFLKPVFKRDENNQVVYQIVGHERVPVIESYINGTRLIWHSSITGDEFYPENFKTFGTGIPLANIRPGTTVGNVPSYYPKNTLSHGSFTLDPNGATVQLSSTMYPILDALFVYDGDRGNRIGFTFTDVTTNNSTNINLSASLGSYLYGLQIIEIDPVTNRRTVINNLDGESTSQMVFGESVYNPRDNTVLSVKDILEEKYDLFEKVHFYKSNYDKVMKDIINGRSTGGIVVEGETNFFHESTESLALYGIVDILRGVGTDGNPYTSFTVEDGPGFNGILINHQYPIMGMKGSDGLVYDASGAPNNLENLRLFDEAVKAELLNFGETGFDMRDMAKYPITTLWDTGFSIETKKALAGILARRRDVWIALATFTVADYIDVVEVDDSRISCAGASTSAAWYGSVLDAIEIDGDLYQFPNDTRLQALGDRLATLGVRLFACFFNGSYIKPANGITSLKAQVEAAIGSQLYYYRDIPVENTGPRVAYYIESINPTKETRVRIRPGTTDGFDPLSEIIGQYFFESPESNEFDYLNFFEDQNRTLGKHNLKDGPIESELFYYQLIVCLSKYVPRAISCAGATSEAAFILDPKQLYSLKINGVQRGVGLTIKDMMSVFTAIRLDTRAYLATPEMIAESQDDNGAL